MWTGQPMGARWMWRRPLTRKLQCIVKFWSVMCKIAPSMTPFITWVRHFAKGSSTCRLTSNMCDNCPTNSSNIVCWCTSAVNEHDYRYNWPWKSFWQSNNCKISNSNFTLEKIPQCISYSLYTLFLPNLFLQLFNRGGHRFFIKKIVRLMIRLC